MKIFNYAFTNNYNYGISHQKSPFNNRYLSQPITDTFIRSDNISFTAKQNKEKKAVENNLKNIDGLHDPYSDIVLLTPNKKEKILHKLEQKKDAAAILSMMSKYTCHMFEPEKEVYNKLLQNYEKLNKSSRERAKNITLSELLLDILPESKSNLVSQQLDIFDTMRAESRINLSKESYRIVGNVIDDIVESIYTDEFRTQKALSSLQSIKDIIPEKNKFLQIYSIADDLPRSATSSDVFVIKNYIKSDIDIAMALISPAEATIEHIRPQSTGGQSTLNNYIVASKRMNNTRSSLSLEEFVQKYPNVSCYTQRYMNDLINKVNNKNLKNIGMSIPDVKEQLKKESNGLIGLDISNLDVSYLRAAEEFNINIMQLSEHFNQIKT